MNAETEKQPKVQPEQSSDALLEVRNLKTYFYTEEGEVRAVDDATFSVKRGKILAIVGESGCGKTVTAYSILRLIQEPGKIVGGQILLNVGGETINVAKLNERSDKLFDVRGGLVSMIFQEPMTALSPVHTIGNQLCEAILLHQDVTKKQAEATAADMLSKVGIPGARERLSNYPHELSGGMRQRAMIAMALVCKPELLIADEPTTALDVTIQAQILELIRDLQRETGFAVILITHDLGVVAQTADDVAVMYLGRIVEEAPIRDLMKDPRHPYTQGLLLSLPSLSKEHEKLPSIEGSVPSLTELPPGCPFHPRCPHCEKGRCDVGGPPEMQDLGNGRRAACLRVNEISATAAEGNGRKSALAPSSSAALLSVRRLCKFFPVHSKGFLQKKIGDVKAVNDVSFDILPGETLGLVGESGCGKTTLARTILRALDPTSGEVLFRTNGSTVDLVTVADKELTDLRKRMQMIFQDPFASLNPRMTVASTVGEPLVIHGLAKGRELKDRVAEMLKMVGLKPEHMNRYPHAFSGGQRQRIGIARALVMRPAFVVADEAVSALDVSVQAQVINLLADLQEELKLTYIFVAHDLSVVQHISDRVAVMYAGKIVELADTKSIFNTPQHPYTEALMAAVPHPDPDIWMEFKLGGEVADPANLPSGCSFHPRCPLRMDKCDKERPELKKVDGCHVACHLRG